MKRGDKLPLEHINFLFSAGGLGDGIARLSAIRYINENFTHVVAHLWVQNYLVDFAKHVLPKNDRLIIRSYDDAKKKYNNFMTGVNADIKQHTSMRTHLSNQAFNVLVDRQVEDKEKDYCQIRPEEIDITEFKLPEKFVVMTTGHTARVREMAPNIVNAVVDYIKEKGYDVVFLGQRHTQTGAKFENIKGNFNAEIDYSKGLDLIDSTSLLEAAAIMSKATAVVGLDNGLCHLAATTQVAIVVGFTTVEPELRLPYRHGQLGWNCYEVVPNESLDCRFCQSKTNFHYNFDYRFCKYDDYKCIQDVSADKYIAQLEKILS